MSLEGHRVAVTGAAQGLGAAVARAFADAGAQVLALDRDADGLARLAEETGAAALPCDLAAREGQDTAAGRLAAFAPATLVHNAAILKPAPFAETGPDLWDATMGVGIGAGYRLARACWPAMDAAGGGALIFVSSRSGIEGFAEESAYCAAKHALEGLSKCLALEGADRGILSCTITPGMYMRTPMSEANYPPELKAKWVEPSRLAPAFLHIATTRDPALSGQRLDAWSLSQSLSQEIAR
ncbi:SDR family NAD(P)-dependent oxidoreductase [Wenxinia saemankumensis]|uniref:3-hydroxybutyrate dehydrogenase n=1 Tax=Wenxinia saemankumensis TaxID=1447782 RepID=A0A1M6D063_9RHOB|nr:SDR family oxidoreductase [Wenxinia saemankumensis]SHI66636.1 3-hydroxybutyrate dehydrogenase [Wenxinia saemankumensis]